MLQSMCMFICRAPRFNYLALLYAVSIQYVYLFPPIQIFHVQMAMLGAPCRRLHRGATRFINVGQGFSLIISVLPRGDK